MRTWTLTPGEDGWRLDIATVPAWAHAAEKLWEQVVWLADPCCCPPWRWFSHWLPEPFQVRWEIAHARLTVAVRPGWRRQIVLHTEAVDVETAQRIDPEFVADLDQILAEDDEPEPVER